MAAFRIFTFFAVFCDVDAHAGLMDPPPWMDRGGQFFPKGSVMNTCAALNEDMYPVAHDKVTWTRMGLNCYWFQNHTFVPDSKSIQIKGDSPYATYGILWGTDRLANDRFPWSHPGSAPIDSPCGMDGGNPRGCWTGNGYALNDPVYKLLHGHENTQQNREVNCGGGSYKTPSTSGHLNDARTFPFLDIQTTEVIRGGTLRTAWGIIANHGGGYAYRLCKMNNGMSRADVTEECFQAGHLNFKDDFSEVQKLDGSPLVIPVDTFAGDDGPWRRNPIPACGGPDLPGYTWTGGVGQPVKGCPTWFPPPAQAPELYGFGYGDGDGYRELLNWYVVDRMEIPHDLPLGDYALSFRYDSEQGSQVWSACSSIKVVGGQPPAWVTRVASPPAPAPPPSPSSNAWEQHCNKEDGKVPFGLCTSMCCSETHACGYCGGCVGKKETDLCPDDPRNSDSDPDNDLTCGGCQTWCGWCMRDGPCYAPGPPTPPPAPKLWDYNCKKVSGFVPSGFCTDTCCSETFACGYCGDCVGQPGNHVVLGDKRQYDEDPNNDLTCQGCFDYCGWCFGGGDCYHDPRLDVPNFHPDDPFQPPEEPEPEPEPVTTAAPEPEPEPVTTAAPEPEPEPVTTAAPAPAPQPPVACTEEGARQAVCGDPELYRGENTITWPDRSTTCDRALFQEGGWVFSSDRCHTLTRHCCADALLQVSSDDLPEPRPSGMQRISQHVHDSVKMQVDADGRVKHVEKTKFGNYVRDQHK